MKIEIIELQSKIELLNSNFTNSFFKNVRDNYLVVFENSNVVDEIETLDKLLLDFSKKKPSYGMNKDRDMLYFITEVYTYLITVYRHLTNTTMLSPKFKRYELVKYLQDYAKEQEKINPTPHINDRIEGKIDSINKIINPTLSTSLTQKEKAQLRADAIVAKKSIKQSNK
jgi:hypothetical protein